MGANYGRYFEKQVEQLCLTAQGVQDRVIADLQGIAPSTIKDNRSEMLEIRPDIRIRNRLGLILDMYNGGWTTVEDLVPDFRIEGLVELSDEEKYLLGHILQSGNFSAHSLHVLDKFPERKLVQWRKSISQKLFGKKDANFLTTAIGYSVYSEKRPFHNIVFVPEGKARGEAIKRVPHQAAIIYDIISRDFRNDEFSVENPVLVAVGGKDLENLLDVWATKFRHNGAIETIIDAISEYIPRWQRSALQKEFIEFDMPDGKIFRVYVKQPEQNSSVWQRLINVFILNLEETQTKGVYRRAS